LPESAAPALFLPLSRLPAGEGQGEGSFFLLVSFFAGASGCGRPSPRPSPAGGRGRFIAAVVVAALLLDAPASATANAEEEPAAAEHGCVPVGQWIVPDGRQALPDAIGEFALRPVVLLGETHTDAEHHRWQLQTVAALYGRRPDMVLGFEMFPRRVQPVLDRWVRGELSERAFLDEVRWSEVWGYDPALYMPLFHFARMHRVPMVALNVDRALVRRVSAEGWDAVPAGEREGIGDPAPAAPAYRDRLRETFDGHTLPGKAAEGAGDDPARFDRFVAAQLLWDRAMAEGLAAAVGRQRTDAPQAPPPLVVGIMGAGHVEHRGGVPHQLASLGIAEAAVLLPWNRRYDCAELTPDLADAVFGIDPPPSDGLAGPPPPRLGVALGGVPAQGGGIPVEKVSDGSVAAHAGLKPGDVVVEAAGQKMARAADLTGTISRQAPGTWLPLKIRRGGKTVALVAKFPP